MCSKVNKYPEERSPKQDGQYKGQDSNSHILERRLWHRNASY